MKALILRVALVLGVLALLAPGTALADKSYAADRFDVNVAVQADGSLTVAETVVFRFAGGPFTYVFRDLPTDYTDGLSGFQATLDGARLPEGTLPGQVEITGTNPIRVRWHFAPTSDSIHTFGLTYRALGVVRQESDSDALYWQALPHSYEYHIASSTVQVTWENTSAKLLGAPQLTQGQAAIESDNSGATFTARDLNPNAPLLFALKYARGSLLTAPPQWQVRADEAQAHRAEAAARQAELAPWFILLAVIVFLGGTLALFTYWNRYRRETAATAAGAFRPERPPDELPPAIAGALNGNAPAWPNALAALFDLARRGVIQIDEIPSGGWFHSRDFSLTRLSDPTDLRPHEQALLALLFESKKGNQSSVKLSQVTQNLSRHWKRFADALDQEMQARGLIDPARQRARRRLNLASTVLVLLGAAGFVAGLALVSTLGGAFVLVPLGVIGAAMAGFLFAHALSRLSDPGAREAARWQEFYQYLRYVISGKETSWRSDLFEAYLRYAASYGLAEGWAKYFNKKQGIPIPAWFHALAGSNPADEMGSFAAMVTATNSAGSEGAGAAGAGAGAAGGGASGAG